MGLNATMGMSQQQNAFDQAIHEFQQNLQLNRWNTRQQALFGGGMSGVSGISSHSWGKGSQTTNPSIMSDISQTLGVIKQGAQLAGSFMAPGVPGADAAAPGGGGWGGMMGMSGNPYG
jgi:hypothetical protein